MRKKILILGPAIYARPFREHGQCILAAPYSLPDEYDLDNTKLMVFTGGHDVDPVMYDDELHPTTQSDIQRDKMEAEFYNEAKKRRIPMVGICRGSQFLTVMNGGKLIQNVQGHHQTHSIKTRDGVRLSVTSTHHQIMNPFGKFDLLAWADGLSPCYETGSGKWWPKSHEKHREPEVVWYPVTKSLAVQFHPEYMNADTKGYKYFQSLIKEYVL